MKTKIVTTEDIYKKVKNYLETFVHFDTEYQAALTALYAMFTWVYEMFDRCPYLQVSGERDTGKTVLVTALDKICNNSRMISGDSARGSIIQILKQGPGTTIIDPFIMRPTNFTRELVKVLNFGRVKNQLLHFVVSKTEKKQKSYVEEEYNPFGPKILVTYDDKHIDSITAMFCLKITLKPVSFSDLSPEQTFPSTQFIEESSKPIREDLQLWSQRFIDPNRTFGLDFIQEVQNTRSIFMPLLVIVRDTGSKNLMDLIKKQG